MKNHRDQNAMKNNIMKPFYCVGIILFVFFMSSCGTQYRLPNYLENLKDSTSLDAYTFPEPIIQKNDILYIQVSSEALDPKMDAPYNSVLLGTGNMAISGNTSLLGYLVDHKGDIEYPRIGPIHAEGLTKFQLANLIKDSLSEELTNPIVNIRFLSFKVIVMGEVVNQGPIKIEGEKLTILEAIGMAGGITWSGKREDLKVIRETNGQREMGIIDLTSSDLFKSPYYHLQQNDIIIVDLNKRGRISQNEQYAMQRIGFAVGLITTFALLINIFK